MDNMIQCPDCKAEASKDALRCPKCGGKLPAYKKRNKRIMGWVFSIILIILIGLAFKAINDDMRRTVKIGEETEAIYKRMDIRRNQEKLDKLTRDFRAGKISAKVYKKKVHELSKIIIELGGTPHL